MIKKRESYRKKGVTTSNIPFHERFQITVGIKEIRRRFVHRVSSQIFFGFFSTAFDTKFDYNTEHQVLRDIANDLGEYHGPMTQFADYTHEDFHRTLEVLELAYKSLKYPILKKGLSDLISSVVHQSGMDLGVSWEAGCFVKTGARLLDERLVNEPLRWLVNPKYSTVYAPYRKALKRYLESEKDPSTLTEAITSVYKALEALAKIVTNRPHKDLSSNVELFISRVAGNQHHKKMLKAYIAYANDFRHALEPGQTERKPDSHEVENFIYLTGLFIRLAAEKLNRVKQTK